MSGGHYDHRYFHLNVIADDIEKDFVNDGKYEDIDYSVELNNLNYWVRPTTQYDRLSDATIEQKEIILKEVKSLINDLRKCSERSKELEWYMSGDTGATSYLERLNNLK